MKKIIMEKFRKNQKLLCDSAFMEKLNKNILIDIIKEFIPRMINTLALTGTGSHRLSSTNLLSGHYTTCLLQLLRGMKKSSTS